MERINAGTDNTQTPRFGHLLVAGATIATFVLHLAFGVYYATHAGNLPSRTSLHLRGEEFLASYPGWNTDHEKDGTYFNRIACSILETGLPRLRTGEVTLHAPLYGYFVAGCYAAGGIRLWSIAIPQAVLSAMTALAVAATVMQLAQQRRWWPALLAALLYAANLRFAMYVGYIYPTVLMLALFATILWLGSSPLTTGRLVGFSAVVILGIFEQANFFLIATACLIWLSLQAFIRRNWLILGGGLLIGVAVLLRLFLGIIPFTFREHRIDEKDTQVLWEANNPYYESMRWWSLWERRPGNPWTTWQASGEEQSRYDAYLARAQGDFAKAALLWIRENPTQYAKLCLIRLRTTLGPYTGQMSPRNRALSTFYWLLIFPAGFYGWWKLRRLPVSQLALCIYLVLTAFETLVITEWYLRYRLPVELMLTAYAAAGYQRLIRRSEPPASEPLRLD